MPAGPTIAELQLRLNVQGIRVLADLQKSLERVGSREINRQLDNQAKALLGISNAAEKASTKMRLFGGGDIVGGIAKFGIAAMAIKRGFDFVGDSVKSAIDPLRQFQKNLAEVRIKGGADFTPTAMANISEGIKNRVRAGSLFTPQQQAQAGVDLAASGLSPQAVNSMIPTVLRFAQASGISTVDSSKILTNVANQFGIETKNSAAMEKLGDQIVGAANASTINVMDIFNTLKYAGTLANTAKMDPAQILAMTAVLGNRGIVASKGGTGLRSILMSFSRPPRRGKEAARQLAMLGMTQKDLQEGLANPEALLQRMGAEGRNRRLSPAKMLSIVSTAFGQYGSTSADVLMKALQGDVKGEVFRKNIKADGKGGWVFDEKNAVTEMEKRLRAVNGTMQESADIAGNTLDGQLAKLDARMNLLKITLGERLMPTIEKTIGWLDRMSAKAEKWATSNSAQLEQWNKVADILARALKPVFDSAASNFAAAFASFSTSVGKLADAWDATVNGHGTKTEEVDPVKEKEAFAKQFYKEHPELNPVRDKVARDAMQKAWEAKRHKQATAGSNKRIADHINDLGGASREVHELGNQLTGAGTSVVHVKVGVNDKGELKAIVDRLTKGRGGPDLRTESSVNL